MAFNKTTFVARMVYWCMHGNLGYDQWNRWDIRIGGECDCSSLVIWALREAGQDTGGATYTGNLSAALVARGWQRISPNGNPQPGDILLNDVHHVAVYVGNGQLAQASIDERGRASGGQSGDQANETNVKAYYNYPWNAYLRYTGGGTTSTATIVPKEDHMPTLNGIDISSWQNGIDLSEVPADFVIVKATEATNYVNPDCDRALQQAAQAGKLLGIYHFARPGDARAQADFFIDKCKGYIGRAILILDWEADALQLGPAWAKSWLDRVFQVTGIRPLIYMSASVTGQYDWTSVVKANYGLWVAAYALGYQRIDGYSIPSGPTGVKHWPTVAIWQYTSSGHLSGWGGNLDLNIFYGGRAAWAKYAGGAPGNPSANVDTRARTKTDHQLMLDIDGDPQSATYRRFQQVMGTPIDGVKSKASLMVMAFQRWLNTVVTKKDIRAITGYDQLSTDGVDGWRTWKVFQYWAYNVRRDLVRLYAPGWGIWDFADGDPGVRTWKVLQHMLNESYANSGKLLKK